MQTNKTLEKFSKHKEYWEDEEHIKKRKKRGRGDASGKFRNRFLDRRLNLGDTSNNGLYD